MSMGILKARDFIEKETAKKIPASKS